MGTGRLLDNDEVEFLLNGGRDESSRGGQAHATSAERVEAPREVTMRGDLDKINLSDIFQTLAMSKMEGLLRVRGPLESREIHFQDGFVRCVVPRRVETLRLGQRLVRAGLVAAEQLRSALLEQRKSRATLGDILVGQQLVTHDEIDDIVSNQLQEDLFALFTWPQGTFEFYKGEVTDPVLAQRLDEAPSFEVNGVLLEVARRSDEWMRVMDAVGSLDELVLAAEDSTAEGLDEDQLAVWESANGHLTIRDLADQALIGLFDCGRVVRELLDDGRLRKLAVHESLDAATALVEAGEPRRAVIVARAILARGERLDVDTTELFGSLFARCGENRQAADLVLRAAHELDSPDERVRLARHARELDKLSADVLSFLADALARSGTADPTELIDVHADLVDALADRADYADALSVVEQLEATTGDLALCRPRKARILSKLGRQDDAIDALMGLVELYKENGDRERVTAVYEQILKIDYRRKDVARALKGLHASKLARRGRMVAIAAVLVGLGFAGYVQIGSMVRASELAEIGTRIQAAIERDDVQRASEILHEATIRYGESEQLAELTRQVQAREQHRQRAVAEEVDRVRAAALARAIELLRDGQAAEAIAEIRGLAQSGVGEDLVGETLKNAVSTFLPELEKVAQTFPERLPPPPSLEQRPTEQTELLQGLRRDLALPILATARGLLAQREDPALRAALGRDLAPLTELLERIAQSDARATALEDRYAARVERRNLAKELTPLFHEAREHERQNRFEAALEAYRTLARNHPEDDELRAHFEERVERYSTILRYLQVIADATARGDFATAQGQLRAMKRQFPGLPLDSLTRLPVRVRTTPPGAQVRIADKLVGESPLVTSYRPADVTRIHIELDGFQPEETEITGDTVGVVLSLLARVSRWSARRDATVDRAPTPEGAQRLYVADRAGTISCLRARDGALLWTRATQDLSGMLTRPCLVGSDRLVVGSIDGPLRCLRRSDGGVLWTIDDIPTESSAVAHGAAVLVATDDARLLALDASDGRELWQVGLPGPVQTDLVAIDERTVVAIDTMGSVTAVDPSDGKTRWTARVGHGVVCPPGQADGLIAVASEDGSVTLLEATTGRVRWRADEFSNLALTPAICERFVLVPDGRELHVLDRADGHRLRTIRSDADLTAHLARIADIVYVGDASGVVRALDADTLEPRFVLRADGPPLAPITTLEDGTLIAAFQDRTIRAYLPVRR